LYVGNKRSRKPVNPEDDVPISVLNEMEKAEFIRNISTLTKEMLTRQQLVKLLEDVNLKTTGNKEILLQRLQDHYSSIQIAAGPGADDNVGQGVEEKSSKQATEEKKSEKAEEKSKQAADTEKKC